MRLQLPGRQGTWAFSSEWTTTFAPWVGLDAGCTAPWDNVWRLTHSAVKFASFSSRLSWQLVKVGSVQPESASNKLHRPQLELIVSPILAPAQASTLDPAFQLRGGAEPNAEWRQGTRSSTTMNSTHDESRVNHCGRIELYEYACTKSAPLSGFPGLVAAGCSRVVDSDGHPTDKSRVRESRPQLCCYLRDSWIYAWLMPHHDSLDSPDFLRDARTKTRGRHAKTLAGSPQTQR